LVDVSNQHVTQLSNDLVVLSARLVREVRRNSVDLPAASTRMLSLIDELGPSPVGALAQADRCSQPTMTGLVNGLVEKGWVQREPHPDDARSALVTMTPEGRRKLTAVRRRNAALVAQRIESSGRSEEELATAVAVLSDLLHHDQPSNSQSPNS
jgi:DNA-binding MarR family transcriptional regulator